MKICKGAYTLKDFTTKLLILYLLNVIDLLFTKILLSTGEFIEANYLLLYIINNNLLSIMIKILFVAALFIWIINRIKNASELQLNKACMMVNVMLFIYAGIDLNHIIWTLIYINKL